MQIWLDTINLEVVADAVKAGIISGITTNPSILSKTKNVSSTLRALLELQTGPIAVQVTSEDADNMLLEGREIFEFSNRTIIKIPVNQEGLIAIAQLHKESIPVLGTGIFHPIQAMLAAKQGATYISPYFSHIQDIANPYESLKDMMNVIQEYPTKILAASIRNIDDLIYCACLGVNSVTIKDDLYFQIISEHSLLEKASQKFQSDWQAMHGTCSIKDLLSTTNAPI